MPLLGKSLTFVVAVLVWINSPTNEMCSLGNQGSPCLIAHTIACIILGFKWWQIRVERMRFLRNWNECPSCAGNKQTYQGFWRDQSPWEFSISSFWCLQWTLSAARPQRRALSWSFPSALPRPLLPSWGPLYVSVSPQANVCVTRGPPIVLLRGLDTHSM